jgi:hypothetical protein
MGPVARVRLKAMTLLSLTRDVLVSSASMMPEPHRRGHMATVTPRSVGSLSSFGWQEHLRSLLTRDPAVYATRQKSDPASDGSAPNLAPFTTKTPRPSSTT